MSALQKGKEKSHTHRRALRISHCTSRISHRASQLAHRASQLAESLTHSESLAHSAHAFRDCYRMTHSMRRSRHSLHTLAVKTMRYAHTDMWIPVIAGNGLDMIGLAFTYSVLHSESIPNFIHVFLFAYRSDRSSARRAPVRYSDLHIPICFVEIR